MKLTLEYICITQLQISGERVVFNTVTNIYQRDISQLQIIPQHATTALLTVLRMKRCAQNEHPTMFTKAAAILYHCVGVNTLYSSLAVQLAHVTNE